MKHIFPFLCAFLVMSFSIANLEAAAKGRAKKVKTTKKR